MPRNGTGGYNLPPGINPVVPGTIIATAWANQTLQDIALALTNSVAKDGQTAMTGNLNMGLNRILGVADPVNPTDAVNLGYLDSSALDRIGISGWARPESGTYPPVTKIGDTQINVPAGSGYVIHPTLGVTQIAWTSQDIALTGVVSSWVTTIGVNASGTVVQLNGNVDPEWARSYVILAIITHVDGEIDSIQNVPSILGGVAYAMYDLAMAQRNEVMSGGLITPNALEGLAFDLQPRRLFYYSGTPNDPDDPNQVTYPLIEEVEFFPVAGNNTVEALTSIVPVGFYDPDGAGVITPVPGSANVSTILRLYQMGDQYVMLYGQHTYDTLELAASAVWSEELVMPSNLKNATLTGVIAVKKSATSLSDNESAVIISNPGTGGGSGVVGAPVDSAFQVISVTANTLIDGSYRNTIILVNSASPVTITVRVNTGDPELDWTAGAFCVVVQYGAGAVTVVTEVGGTLRIPSGFEAKPRAQYASVSLSCLATDSDEWLLGGDMLRTALEPGYQTFLMEDRSVLIGTNIAVGTGKAVFVAPYDLKLRPIASLGVYAYLAVAQAAGTAVTIDVNLNGATILSTKLTIANGTKNSIASTPAVYDAAFESGGRLIPRGAEITVDIDAIGTALAKGLVVGLVGERVGA